MAKNKQTINGFTLLEILIVTSVLVLLVSMALPLASGVLMKDGVDNGQTIMNNALSLGQMHGKRLSNDVFLCAGLQQDQCQSNNWNQGMSLFRIDMEGATQKLSLIRVFDAFPAGVQLVFNGNRIRISKHGSFIDGPYALTICNPTLDEYWFEIQVAGFMIETVSHDYDGQTVDCIAAEA